MKFNLPSPQGLKKKTEEILLSNKSYTAILLIFNVAYILREHWGSSELLFSMDAVLGDD